MRSYSLGRPFWILPLSALILLLTVCSDPEESDGFNSLFEQYGEPMTSVPATEDILMYEVNLRAFSPSGDIQGLIADLDRLDSLNINVIWLMPIQEVGEEKSLNSPYCVKNYLEVGSEYGDLEDLRALTTAAHARGMAVILDWVANHTAWDHPWIEEHPDWYQQDADGNIIIPPGTNWADVAQLDMGKASLRAAMTEAMEYWVLEANIDGFRCDYADGVPSIFWKEALRRLKSIPERRLILLAEGSSRDRFSDGFQIIYSWNYYSRLKDVAGGSAANELSLTHLDDYRALGEGYQYLRYSTNHDQSAWDATPVQLFGGTEGALAYAAAAMFSGGIPLIYTGQESGREETVNFFRRDAIDWSENADMQKAFYSLTRQYSEGEAFRRGTLRWFSNDAMHLVRYDLDSDTLLAAVNLRGSRETRTLDEGLWFSRWQDLQSGEILNWEQRLTMDPYEIRLLRK